jgi:DNA-binding response OmpR family regulator
MLSIVLVTARRAALGPFLEGLSSDPSVSVEQAVSGTEVLSMVRAKAPQLVIIDSEPADREPLALIRELLTVNAMVNTAVLSSLSDQEFHDAGEGFGVLARLPLIPEKADAAELLLKLKKILGLIP